MIFTFSSRKISRLIFLFLLGSVSGWADFKEELSGAVGRELYMTAAGVMEARHVGSVIHTPTSKHKAFIAPILGDWIGRAEIVYNARLIDELGSLTIWDKHYSLKVTDAEAQTYGYKIYIGESESNSFEQMSVLLHELVHTRQYRSNNESLGNFGNDYFRGFADGGFDSPKNNPLEKEAYAIQDNFMAIVNAYRFHSREPKPETFSIYWKRLYEGCTIEQIRDAIWSGTTNILPPPPAKWNPNHPTRSITGPPVVTYNPLDGFMQVMARRGNNIAHFYLAPDGWHDDQVISQYGGFNGDPVVVYHPTNKSLHVFALREDKIAHCKWEKGWKDKGNITSGGITGKPIVSFNPVDGKMQVVARRGNNIVHYWMEEVVESNGKKSEVWHDNGIVSIGGIEGDPVVFYYLGDNKMHIFARRGDNIAHSRVGTDGWHDMGSVSIFGNLRGNPIVFHNPADGIMQMIVRRGDNIAHFFWLGIDGWRDNNNISSGNITGTPFVSFAPDGKMQVVARRGDDNIAHCWLKNEGGQDDGWKDNGDVSIGHISGDPIVSYAPDGKMQVIARRGHDNIAHCWLENQGLDAGWKDNGDVSSGRITGQPNVSYANDGKMQVIARRGKQIVHCAQGSDSRWYEKEVIGDNILSDPVVTFAPDGRAQIIARRGDKIAHFWLGDNGWNDNGNTGLRLR